MTLSTTQCKTIEKDFHIEDKNWIDAYEKVISISKQKDTQENRLAKLFIMKFLISPIQPLTPGKLDNITLFCNYLNSVVSFFQFSFKDISDNDNLANTLHLYFKAVLNCIRKECNDLINNTQDNSSLSFNGILNDSDQYMTLLLNTLSSVISVLISIVLSKGLLSELLVLIDTLMELEHELKLNDKHIVLKQIQSLYTIGHKVMKELKSRSQNENLKSAYANNIKGKLMTFDNTLTMEYFNSTNNSKELFTYNAASDSHGLCVTSNGHIYAFGSNKEGQFGSNLVADSLLPVYIPLKPLLNVKQVACGHDFSILLTEKNGIYAMGKGKATCNTSNLSSFRIPTYIKNTKELEISCIGAGRSHCLAASIKRKEVYSWGSNSCNQLGISAGNRSYRTSVTRIDTLRGHAIIQLAGGFEHSLALTVNGRVYSWGGSGIGKSVCGHGAQAVHMQKIPKVISRLKGKKIIQIAAGWNHSLALTSYGYVYGWGGGQNGQLGQGNLEDKGSPVRIKIDDSISISQISLDNTSSLFISKNNGTLYACGSLLGGSIKSNKPILLNVKDSKPISNCILFKSKLFAIEDENLKKRNEEEKLQQLKLLQAKTIIPKDEELYDVGGASKHPIISEFTSRVMNLKNDTTNMVPILDKNTSSLLNRSNSSTSLRILSSDNEDNGTFDDSQEIDEEISTSNIDLVINKSDNDKNITKNDNVHVDNMAISLLSFIDTLVSGTKTSTSNITKILKEKYTIDISAHSFLLMFNLLKKYAKKVFDHQNNNTNLWKYKYSLIAYFRIFKLNFLRALHIYTDNDNDYDHEAIKILINTSEKVNNSHDKQKVHLVELREFLLELGGLAYKHSSSSNDQKDFFKLLLHEIIDIIKVGFHAFFSNHSSLINLLKNGPTTLDIFKCNDFIMAMFNDKNAFGSPKVLKTLFPAPIKPWIIKQSHINQYNQEEMQTVAMQRKYEEELKAKEKQEDTWSCSVCTFINSASATLACSMCGTSKPKIIKKEESKKIESKEPEENDNQRIKRQLNELKERDQWKLHRDLDVFKKQCEETVSLLLQYSYACLTNLKDNLYNNGSTNMDNFPVMMFGKFTNIF